MHVEVERGGTRLVRVRDDGRGMARADAELALERHATSKLDSLDGLLRIATAGFRGEALPAIASFFLVDHRLHRDRQIFFGRKSGYEGRVCHGPRAISSDCHRKQERSPPFSSTKNGLRFSHSSANDQRLRG